MRANNGVSLSALCRRSAAMQNDESQAHIEVVESLLRAMEELEGTLENVDFEHEEKAWIARFFVHAGFRLPVDCACL